MTTERPDKDLGHVVLSRPSQGTLDDLAYTIMSEARADTDSNGYVVSAEVVDVVNVVQVSYVARLGKGNGIKGRIRSWANGPLKKAPEDYVDGYTRGYLQITAANLDKAAMKIMNVASDFVMNGRVADRSVVPEDSSGYPSCAVITRADELHVRRQSGSPDQKSEFLIVPFIVYRRGTEAELILDQVIERVTDAISPLGGQVASVWVVDAHHGNPGLHHHLGREEMHQPRNEHGNSFG